eukprot:35252-Chlamydomonas_euryale.AAC.7
MRPVWRCGLQSALWCTPVHTHTRARASCKTQDEALVASGDPRQSHAAAQDPSNASGVLVT